MRIVFCTCPVDERDKIVNVLLEQKLVACVNVVSTVKSHYMWKGKICHDDEALLIMKTRKELIGPLTEKINEVHSYDVVEVIALEIKEGDSHYLDWIRSVTRDE
ncbi:MAG: dihydroorotate dehydrogenase [bacterium]|nr:MAG: dihydroorotate dehydrogenase [bacterium]